MSGQQNPFGVPPVTNLNVTSTPQVAVEPAGFWRRAGATILDSVILMVMQMPIALLLGVLLAMAGMPESAMDAFGRLIGIVATYVYYGYFYSTKGATPGKMVLGLKVLREETGTHLTWGQAFGREFLKGVFLIFTLTISVLIAAFRQDKKALHDIVCKSRVVRIVK